MKTVLLTAIVAMAAAAPAMAVPVAGPAPVAGIGFGAVVLVGAGYRALKRRIGR